MPSDVQEIERAGSTEDRHYETVRNGNRDADIDLFEQLHIVVNKVRV